MDFGDKVLLHSIMHPAHTTDLDEFVIVEITEIRTDVPGMWGNGKHRGYKAKSKSGETYSCAWSQHAEDSPSPYWQWFGPGGMWYDVVYLRKIPAPPKFLDIDEFSFVSYCVEHQSLYYLAACWGCELNMKASNPVTEYWNGWF